MWTSALAVFFVCRIFNSPGVSQREKRMDQTWAFWINHSGWIVAPWSPTPIKWDMGKYIFEAQWSRLSSRASDSDDTPRGRHEQSRRVYGFIKVGGIYSRLRTYFCLRRVHNLFSAPQMVGHGFALRIAALDLSHFPTGGKGKKGLKTSSRDSRARTARSVNRLEREL